MAWEQRGGRAYYYRGKRSGGRVHKEYVGGGLVGTLTARLDEQERAKAAASRAADLRTVAALDALEQEMREADRLVMGTLTRTLEALGYYRHRRGEWRRRGPQA